MFIRVADIVDILLVALLVWGGLVWLRKSRARLALLGLAYLAGVYLLARLFGLQLTAWMLQGFFAAFVLILVVVFQEDLRRLFERLALWGLRRTPSVVSKRTGDVLARTVSHLAQQRTGALIVLTGRDPIDRHLDGGLEAGGRLSEALLLSLFNPTSPGHDGAVVLEGDLLTRFAVHLPLSVDLAQLESRGTRHAAALGLAELTDALAIVVSEERGSVSIAHDGVLRQLDNASALTTEIVDFQLGLAPAGDGERFSLNILARHWRAALLSVSVAVLLWFGLVWGTVSVDETRQVPVSVVNLPPGYTLLSVEPPEAKVVLSGSRREFLLARKALWRVEVDSGLVEAGRRTFSISPSNVVLPTHLVVVSVSPDQVKLSVEGKIE